MEALNAAFKVFMWVTMIFSMVKMIASIFYDFDTPFKKAAEAAGILNKELKKTLENLGERPDNINFDGMASSFNDALKNANFAANLADEIYNATHKAMEHLGKELGNMNWFDKLLDKIKEVLNLKSLDEQLRETLTSSIALAQATGGKLPEGVK
jgi:hypothetical protein